MKVETDIVATLTRRNMGSRMSRERKARFLKKILPNCRPFLKE